jgi:hypothetical protein
MRPESRQSCHSGARVISQESAYFRIFWRLIFGFAGSKPIHAWPPQDVHEDRPV